MTMTLVIALVAAAVIFLLVMGISSLFQSRDDKADKRIKGRLHAMAMESGDKDSIDLLLREASMSEVPWFNRVLENMRFASNVDKIIKQANTKGSAGVYLLLCAFLAIVGCYAGIAVSERIWVGIALCWLMGNAPLWHLKRLKRARMDKFHTQLPEALELMGRSLKAGHTFAGGMRMVADEFEDPIGPEFGQTLDEINYGMDVDRALDNLLDRVDCTDLKFFVVSVNIQRETGGNLAEIIAKIADLVRERFVLFGKVKILSAEGRLSALILTALPFLIAGILYVVNSDYMSLLWKTEIGKGMLWGAVVSMAFGIVVIRKVVQIKV